MSEPHTVQNFQSDKYYVQPYSIGTYMKLINLIYLQKKLERFLVSTQKGFTTSVVQNISILSLALLTKDTRARIHPGSIGILYKFKNEVLLLR